MTVVAAECAHQITGSYNQRYTRTHTETSFEVFTRWP